MHLSDKLNFFSHLRNNVKIWDESTLQYNRYITRVEQLNWIRACLATEASWLDGQINAKALKVNDNGKDEHGRQQIGQIGKVLSVEGLLERAHFIVARGQQVKERNDGALEFRTTTSVDCRRTKRLPHDCLANVRGNKQRNARAETVAFLQELIKKQHYETSDEQLYIY